MNTNSNDSHVNTKRKRDALKRALTNQMRCDAVKKVFTTRPNAIWYIMRSDAFRKTFKRV